MSFRGFVWLCAFAIGLSFWAGVWVFFATH